MENELIIAVISDLHCRHSGTASLEDVSTYLTSDLLGVPDSRHPIKSLLKLFEKGEFRADIILCPGDITDKADRQGLLSGWGYLLEIKGIINPKILAATTGNHDVDSFDIYHLTTPNDDLQQLSKYYPTDSTELNTAYWTNHFCIIEHSSCNILLVNSSYSQKDPVTAKQCRLSLTVISQIDAELSKLKNGDLPKICLLHHHPIHHSNIDYVDADFIDKGDELLTVLAKHKFSIVIHGHKHDPRLTKHQNMAIFAAGSFSSLMNLKDIGSENTFHLVKLKCGSNKGKIESWVFGPRYGWKKRMDSYFPCNTGFGSELTTEKIAEMCNAEFRLSGSPVSYQKLTTVVPDIEHLVPLEQLDLSQILKNKYTLCFVPDLPNLPNLLMDF